MTNNKEHRCRVISEHGVILIDEPRLPYSQKELKEILHEYHSVLDSEYIGGGIITFPNDPSITEYRIKRCRR